ncbi:MAG: hypothetical protein ACI4AI_07370 [Paludibacteraceae bacterium]
MMKRVWRKTIVVAALLVCVSAYGVYAQTAPNETAPNPPNRDGGRVIPNCRNG